MKEGEATLDAYMQCSGWDEPHGTTAEMSRCMSERCNGSQHVVPC